MRQWQVSTTGENFCKAKKIFGGMWDFRYKNWKTATATGEKKCSGAVSPARTSKEECGEFSLVETALEQHWMTCTNRDERNKFSHHSHVEISHESWGPFWLKKKRCLLRRKNYRTRRLLAWIGFERMIQWSLPAVAVWTIKFIKKNWQLRLKLCAYVCMTAPQARAGF